MEAGDDVSVYEFSKFNIYAYDADGEKKDATGLTGNIDAGLVVQIPIDYDGTELSIVPVGEYQPKEISLRDYYIDDDKTEHDLGGTWMINENEYTDDSVKISPSSSYIISYKYDINDFFYVSSEPDCYYNNTEDGTIIFKQRTADDETAEYTVELHRYSQASIISGVDRSVSVNNEGIQTVKGNTELTISNLKYGDKVLIATDKEWKELENNKNLVWIGTEPSSTEPFKYEYTMIVPEKGSEFRFDPKEYKNATYQEAYVRYQSAAEEKYHVSNRVSIYIENLQEEQKLEVLRVNDVEFIIENKEDNKENIISWLEVPGEGTFVVDLKAGEYIIDEERASVLVRVPYPELTNVKIDYANVQKILFQNDIFDDSIKIGEELAKSQLDKADALIRKEFASNENFYLNAQQAARHTIEGMVKQLNPDVSGLTVDVEFYNYEDMPIS